MSSQIELRATVSAQLADLLEGYFYETQSAYWGIMQKERTDPYEVFGFFPDTATADSELGLLQEEFSELHEDFELSRIEDSFWQNAYKEFVTTWSDRRLHWIPLWERDNCKPPAGSAIVYLDAGMAFGTGAHETTRLCARRLIDYLDSSEEALESLHIIDAGCGSGVLAFSAAALACSEAESKPCEGSFGVAVILPKDGAFWLTSALSIEARSTVSFSSLFASMLPNHSVPPFLLRVLLSNCAL